VRDYSEFSLYSKLPTLSGKELSKILIKLGFIETHITGSHHVFKHTDGRKTVIPIHGNEEIGPGLLLKIIKKDVKISRDDFLRLCDE